LDGKVQSLAAAQDENIINIILIRDKAFQPLMKQETVNFAQVLSSLNGEVKYLGKNWDDRFFPHHPSIELKPSRVVDAARKRCAAQESLQEYYGGLYWIIREKLAGTSQIYNVNETAVQKGETTLGIVAGMVLTSISEKITLEQYTRSYICRWSASYSLCCIC
jgi:hypothetical protein